MSEQMERFSEPVREYVRYTEELVGDIQAAARYLEIQIDYLRSAGPTGEAEQDAALAGLESLGLLRRKIEGAIDFTLLFAGVHHVSHRRSAKALDMNHATVARRVQRIIEQYSNDGAPEDG